MAPGNLAQTRGNSILNVLEDTDFENQEEHTDQVYDTILEMVARRPMKRNPFKKLAAINEFTLPNPIPPNVLGFIQRLESDFPDFEERKTAIFESSLSPYLKWVAYELSLPKDPIEVLEANPEMKYILYDYLTAYPTLDEQLHELEDERFSDEEKEVLESILVAVNKAKRMRKYWANKKGGTRRRRNRRSSTQRKRRT
jgi:hypothetical protein